MRGGRIKSPAPMRQERSFERVDLSILLVWNSVVIQINVDEYRIKC
jgi:hypothetical protein